VDICGTVPTAGCANHRELVPVVRAERDDACVIRAEIHRLTLWEERHRRLFGRLLIVLVLTALIDVIGTMAVYAFERNAQGGDIRSLGDALFFTTVQLLTVSSQIRNPLTAGGRIVDVFLEVWAVVVVAGSAGAIASFFQTGDS
jgi:hypothetical protein